MSCQHFLASSIHRYKFVQVCGIAIFQNLDYEIVSGARRQENRWDPTSNEQVVPETRETSRKLFDDAMFKLEHKNNDLNVSKKSSATLNRLMSRQEDVWKDDFAANSFLRARFRV